MVFDQSDILLTFCTPCEGLINKNVKKTSSWSKKYQNFDLLNSSKCLVSLIKTKAYDNWQNHGLVTGLDVRLNAVKLCVAPETSVIFLFTRKAINRRWFTSFDSIYHCANPKQLFFFILKCDVNKPWSYYDRFSVCVKTAVHVKFQIYHELQSFSHFEITIRKMFSIFFLSKEKASHGQPRLIHCCGRVRFSAT